jgi:hypothetical protein
MAAYAGLHFDIERGPAVVTLAAESPLSDLLHGDSVSASFHFENLGVAHIAAKARAVHPVGENGRRKRLCIATPFKDNISSNGPSAVCPWPHDSSKQQQ